MIYLSRNFLFSPYVFSLSLTAFFSRLNFIYWFLPPQQERSPGGEHERETQEVSDLQRQLGALKVTLHDEKERLMAEKTKVEEQHKVLENQLRRQGKNCHPTE